jgi:hypothetical protein
MNANEGESMRLHFLVICSLSLAVTAGCSSTDDSSSIASATGGAGATSGSAGASATQKTPELPTSITIQGDSTSQFGTATVTSVTCVPNVHVTFPFPDSVRYGSTLTVAIVPGDNQGNNPRIVVETGNHVIDWDGVNVANYPTTGSATIARTELKSDESFVPGNLTISGTYDCD